ncbi:hypothetical protein ANN_08204, partial [Periplaneta americana]
EEERASEKGRPEAERYDEEEEEGEYSDADDFIVDDDGRPIADRRKKRKPIFSDAALQEAQDIFGVDFDYGILDTMDEDGYEEEEEEEEDEYIDEEGEDTEKRNTDIPERMQLRDFPVTAVPEGSDELDEEAEWIYKQAFCKPTISNQDGHSGADARERARKGPQTIGKIKKALDFMRNQHFEVPFIAFYRKEYVQPELNINDLWKVYKYDEKWCQLRTRKTNLITLFEKMRDYQAEQLMKEPDKPIPDNVRLLKDEDIDRLRAVQTTEELKDVHTHFLLYYSHEVPEMQKAWRAKEREAAREARKNKHRRKANAEGEDGEDGEQPEEGDEVQEEENEPEAEEEEAPENETVKQAVRSGPYSMCRKAGLGGFNISDGLAKRFGLTPEQFGENLRDNYQRHEVEQEPTEPIEVAREYISNKFNTAEEVLKAAKFMVAMQISRDPLVRKCVRETFFERAKINIKPTKKGVKEIDENHPCYSMKYVKTKPVRDLTGDQYLKLTIAETDKVINVSISERIDGITSTSYIDEVKQLYYRDEFSKNVQDWNALRVDSVELALTRLLLPELRKELQTHLLAEAREAVLKTCCRKLYNWLKVAPYTVEFADEDEEEWDTSKGLRVMAVAYVPDYSQAAFACMVGPDGDCTDYLRLPYLLKRKNSFREEEKLQKEADLLAIRNFITTKKPHMICVGGESREALMVAADLREIVGQLVEDDQFPSISVEICDNELAKIYSNSIKGESEFRDYPQLLRQAISLARRMQDPLIEFSQLCTSDEEILCLRYHTLQDQIPREELLEALYLEFVNRTNEVGVDINLAVLQSYTCNLVQFVCGLGPRKGQALLKTLKQNNQRLENRTQLVTACHMGPKVFINCAGFIKIDTNSLGDSTEAYVEVLDGSRVHPETYEWARKMAVDALEYDDEDANPAGALEEILESPERLKDLDLDAFAEELERQGFGNKSITLYDIRAELNHRYKDLRSPYSSPNPEELFDMLTKETPETFFIGKMVLATVIGISHRKPQGDQLDQANPVRNDETGLWQCPFCLKNDFPELSELENLKEEMRRNRMDVMGISEVKWKNSGELVSDEFKLFYSNGECKESHGVGVLLGPRVKDKVISVLYVDDQVIMVRLQGKKMNLLLVQVYMPHSGLVDEEVEESYDKIEEIVEKKKGACVILMGDWNAVVGEDQEEEQFENMDWEEEMTEKNLCCITLSARVWNHFDAGGCPGQATGVRLRLDNGISGYIHIKNLSDKHVSNPEDRVARGQTIHCRVTKIDVERFSVECTSKSSDLADKNHEWRPPKDPFYDNESEEKDIKTEEEAKKMKQRQTYIKRVIVHPSFHNISFKEAERLMDQMDQGEVIVRPSSKGSDHLTVTWKVTDGVYQHIDVREEGKENAFSLGQSLWIGNEEFEDLDEIIARYVNPMAAHARDLLSFKYYRDTEGLKDKAEEVLKEEKKKNASKIHYVLSASKSFPGKFMLSYLPRTRCRHEYITVTPEGFRFRQQMFDSVGSLFRWFKDHFRDPIPGTPSTPRGAATNRTPYHGTPNLAGMNPEAIQRVAQNLPNHMLHSLSQVASQTPHYPHTPGGGGYGANMHTYPNTPYTPSGQTPFMTPYHTPHATQTPRYGQQTPSHHPPHHNQPFLHPGSVTPAHRTPTHRIVHTPHTPHSRPAQPSTINEPTDWRKAAEAWAKLKNRDSGMNTPRQDGRSTPRQHSSGNSTPRFDDLRKMTPRYDESGRGTPRSSSSLSTYGIGNRQPMSGRLPYGLSSSGKSPRSSGSGRESMRSTPRTNTSPHSMVESSLSGDATPLYDEN